MKNAPVGDGFQPSRNLPCRKHPDPPDRGGCHNAVGGNLFPPYESGNNILRIRRGRPSGGPDVGYPKNAPIRRGRFPTVPKPSDIGCTPTDRTGADAITQSGRLFSVYNIFTASGKRLQKRKPQNCSLCYWYYVQKNLCGNFVKPMAFFDSLCYNIL